MKESVNKVRPKDDRLEDNTAALELVAETSEELKNSVEKNTLTTDRNTERMQQLEKRLADMNMPVHRFSEDKPEQVQSVRSVIEPTNAPVSNPDTPINKPESGEKQPKIEPKIKRKEDSFGMSIANAGKTFAASVYQAGADFGKSMTDQIGSELLPFYSDMKAAASKVTGGAIEAGKLVKSRFERKAEEKKEKRTGIVPQAVIEKTEKLEKVKELREKFRDRKRDHADHKVISTLKDIRGDLRKMMLIGLLKSLIPDFGSFGAAIGRFAGMFAKGGLITAFFLGMKNWAVKFGEASLKGIKSAFTSITSGIKETFTKTVDSIKDGWKKMFPDKPKVETASPKSKAKINPAETKKPVLDKDGKPVLDKDGKPKFETKAVNTVERNVEKSSFEKMTTKAVVAEGGEVAAEKVGKDQLLKRMASKAGGRVVAGAAGGPVGEIVAALLLVKDAIELGFDMLGIKLDPAKWIDEKLGTDSEAAGRAGLGKPLEFKAANPYESKKLEEIEQQAKQAVAEAKERDMQKQAAMVGQTVGNSVNTTNVVNKGNSSPTPSPFPTTATISAMSQAFNGAFKRN
ncbi:hypothetical protein HXV88_08570 [Aeromonas veronii]|uniref:hypothetical protein n=1 Tax=Aeromonas veronii TaxID=654 RepID=UPI0015D0170E|nr:hypothetical protein [Aeromonas veronii]QLH66505.1 hypothetical protein HXV88_08570 [Aeromonas veronii]